MPEATEQTARLGAVDGLRLRDFRNFSELECGFPRAGVIIVGPNGSGKTNLLEAIYYLEIFRSFRGANDAELVRFGEDVFRIEASLETPDRTRELAAAYSRSGRRKKVEVDGREVSRLSDAIGTLGAVVFSLDDVELVKGPPKGRRRFLDILLSLVVPGYMDALRSYRSVLEQRNEALREGEGTEVVEAFGEGLVRAAATVMWTRDRWVADRSADFGAYHAAISGGDRGRIAYEPSAGVARAREAGPGRPEGGEAVESEAGSEAEGGTLEPSREAWAERFRRALAESAERERRRGMTVVGPQRDELAFEGEVAGGGFRDLRTYGSGGQQRTAALALRLVEADTIRDALGREPVYLLDDVFAELDRERSELLLRLLDDGRSGQVIVTAPKPADLGLRGGGLARWRIRDGEIET